MSLRWCLLPLLLWLALPAFAQETAPPAILVADEIELTRERVLIARGNVEAYQGQTRLRATEIRFDDKTGQLSISGPITIEEGQSILVLADQGELSRDLQNGLLRGARIVLDEQLQMAAVEMARVGGRYSQLYKSAVTSCQVCEGDPRPPLWQIRAQRVVHDTVEKQIYFDRAQFRIRSIPVFYFPRLRLPDPTLDRATGFLIPGIVSTSQLGLGVRVPYFIKLGDHRDITLIPLLSSSTRTLGFRYRQAFRTGRIEFDGALTDDDLRPGETRGYLFGQGAFDLPNAYKLSFGLQTSSDDAYLKDYNFSDADRLLSFAAISRTKRDLFQEVRLTNFRTLRESEDNNTLPTNVIDGIRTQRFFPRAVGGEVRLTTRAHGHFRTSDLDVDGADADLIVDGRDIYRVSVDADWRRSWFLGGLETQALLGASLDAFEVAQDSTFDDRDSRALPHAMIMFRYPLARQTSTGSQVLEPVLQLAWSGEDELDVPNEESTRVEFDEGNLFALSRFPAPDRRETGFRTAIGLNFAHFGETGREYRFALGQIYRSDPDESFSDVSGLSGEVSDLLVAGQIKLETGFALSARTIFDNGLDLDKAELRSQWQNERLDIAGSYIWIARDVDEEREGNVSEFNFDGQIKLNDVWRASANWRFDFDAGRAATTGLGLEYQNECVRIGFSVDRRFTSSSSVEPQTSLGLTVSLQGFATRPGTEKYMRACGKHTS